MRKAMLKTLVSMALCLTAAGLATAAGGPASDPKSSFQAQPRPQSVAQSRIVMGPGAFGTIAPVPRRHPAPRGGIPEVTQVNCYPSQARYCAKWYRVCLEAAHDPDDRQNCKAIYNQCLDRAGC
jgi:hypothetical protein